MKLSLASSKICAVLTNTFAVDGTGHYNVQYCQNLWQEEKKKKGGGGCSNCMDFSTGYSYKSLPLVRGRSCRYTIPLHFLTRRLSPAILAFMSH